VSSALRLDSGEPLVALFGLGVSDLFVGTDYREYKLEESLWHALRAAGFLRIVFSSANSPAYFLDEPSRDFIRLRVREANRRGRPASRPRGGSPGNAPRRTPPTGANPVSRGAGRTAGASAVAAQGAVAAMGTGPRRKLKLDVDVLRVLDVSMRNREAPTAVVIVRAENFLQYTSAERDLAEWFAEWPQAPAAVDNVCLLVFGSGSWDKAVESVRSLGHLSALCSYLERQAGRGVGEIGEPDAAEIERIVHLARLRYGLAIGDWGAFDRMIAALAAQPGVRAVAWSRRLVSLARARAELSEPELRRRKWVEALPSGQSAWERLNELTGLAEVKEHIDLIRWRAQAEAKRRREGLLRESGSLHLVFTGRPGTGKTTVARLIGEMYREMGILRRGHLHAPEAADLIGMYVGHTAVQMSRAIDAALDGVLFIDEAYRLNESPGGFGQEAIDTLVTRMDNDRDRLVVIVAGYPDKMDAFLRSNPGLPRRFPRGNIIAFPDYEPDALRTILLGMLRDRGLRWVPELEPLLDRVVTGMYAVRDDTFGNAGEMRNLVQELETNWARRVRADITEPVTPDDLPASYREYA
jgi:ATPase family associated with various cellular activities (AAA)/AAA lid domain